MHLVIYVCFFHTPTLQSTSICHVCESLERQLVWGDGGVPSNLQPAGWRCSAKGNEKVPKGKWREGGSVCWEQIVASITEEGDKKLGKAPSYIIVLNNVTQVTA